MVGATKGHPINVKLDDGKMRSQVEGALISDGIATAHTGMTVSIILSVVWDSLAAIAAFTLSSGVSWKHIGTEHIVANVYMALRTSSFVRCKKSANVYFSRSFDFLNETYGHGMGHVLANPPRAETPSTPKPPARQPFRCNESELHRAVRNGSKRRTVALLSAGTIDIEEAGPMGYTPLLLGAYYQHPSVVDTLLRAGANVSAATDENFTALGISVEKGNLAIASMCLKAGADVNARYIDGWFPLYRATLGGNLAMARLLVKAGGSADTPFKDGETPLHAAATVGAFEMVLLFIEGGVDVNVRMIGGYTALHMAGQCGHGGIIEALLAAGADPLLGSSDGTIMLLPLDYAVAKGHMDAVDSLLAAGGIDKCGGESGGLNALRYAVRKGDLEALKTLSRAGVIDDGGALLVAINKPDEDCVRFLLELWRDNRDSMPPRYLNVDFSNQTLSPHGLSATRGSVTPLTLAIRKYSKYSSCKIVQRLVELGADTALAVTVHDTGGIMTPLGVVDLCHSRYEKKSEDDFSGERLLAIGRLLHQADAIRASSWLWPSCREEATAPATAKAKSGAAFRVMLQNMKRRVGTVGLVTRGTRKLPNVLLLHEARKNMML